ncbi:hypothetical protein [Streptomyces sp. NPDC094149]|uniref:hypothetical protein n=1 Tax=Streptomyces sp. NPDC094149 TaxID=3155079 RepID=UPI003331F873
MHGSPAHHTEAERTRQDRKKYQRTGQPASMTGHLERTADSSDQAGACHSLAAKTRRVTPAGGDAASAGTNSPCRASTA